MTFAESLRSVSAQKDPKGVPAYTLYINRRLGQVVAAAAHEVRITPNQLTLASGVIALAGMALLVLREPSTPNSVAVGLLLALAYVFDSADGQLARLARRASAVGEWLDHLIDAAKHVLLPLAVLGAAVRFEDPSALQIAMPLVFQFVAVLMFSSMLLSDLLHRSASVSRPHASPAEIRRSAFAKLPVDYGLLCLSLCLFGTALFWWVYGALLVFAVLYLGLHLLVTVRRLNALTEAKRAASAKLSEPVGHS